jgi:acetolactate synthase regulatory subunit
MEFTPNGVLYAVIFTVLIMAFFLIPYVLEIYLSYSLAGKRDEKAKAILESCIPNFITQLKAHNNQMTEEEIGNVCEKVFLPVQETLKQPVNGIVSFTRGMIAFAIVFLLGIAVMLIMFATKGDPQIVNNIVSMLGATLAAIAGFYFGGRTALESRDASSTGTVQKQPPSPPASPETDRKLTNIQQTLQVLGRTPQVVELMNLDDERRLIEERIHIRARRHHGFLLTEEEKKKLLDATGQEINVDVDSKRYVEIQNRQWELMGVKTKDTNQSNPC